MFEAVSGSEDACCWFFFGDDPEEVEDDLRGQIFFLANCHISHFQTCVFLFSVGYGGNVAVSENNRTPQTKSTSCVKCMMYYLFVFWRVSNLGYHLFWITPMISCSYSCKPLPKPNPHFRFRKGDQSARWRAAFHSSFFKDMVPDTFPIQDLLCTIECHR